jgi:hypothetical protein
MVSSFSRAVSAQVPEEQRPERSGYSCALPDLPRKDRELHQLHAVVYALVVAMIGSWTSKPASSAHRAPPRI